MRARRINTLLKELRDYQRAINEAQKMLDHWEVRATTPDLIERFAQVWGAACKGDSDALRRGDMTHAEVRERAIRGQKNVINGPKRRRSIAHVLNRLSYERSQLGPVARYSGKM